MSQAHYGSFCLVLHSHLPLVLKHDKMDEDWLMEAAAETYIPLLNVLRRLARDKVSPHITIGISPILAEQLSSDAFKTKFKEYCNSKLEYARKDEEDFKKSSMHLSHLATIWQDFYIKTLGIFENKLNQDIIGRFAELQNQGHCEIITCAATHAYLPLLSEDTSISAQIKQAVCSYKRLFGRAPRGIWLPECGYRPSYEWRNPLPQRRHEYPRMRKGIEEFLTENGLEYFCVDENQVTRARPFDLNKSPFDTYLCAGKLNRPVTIFSRDFKISQKVWEHQAGYPGDGAYLEFHKKHHGGWLRYWKITHNQIDLEYKQPYFPEDVYEERIPDHAGHFKELIKSSLKTNYEVVGEPKIAMCSFDSELFGHWWFEGTTWLYYMLQWIGQDTEVGLMTLGQYVDARPAKREIQLPESSWGRDSNDSTWMNAEVHWVWDRVYSAEREVQYLAHAFHDRTDDEQLTRILKQAIRELFYLQASDWEFMITNWSTRDHAETRVVQHHDDFKRLAKMAWSWGLERRVSEEDMQWLKGNEDLRGMYFPDCEISWFYDPEHPPRG